MSIRARITAAFVLLLALMAMLMNYSVKNGELTRTPVKHFTLLFAVSIAVSLLVLFLFYLGWRDIPGAKRRVEGDSFGSLKTYLIGILISSVGLGLIMWFSNGSDSGLPRRNITVPGNTSPVDYSPHNFYGSSNLTNSTSRLGITSSYAFYLAIALFLLGLSYIAVTYYRDALKKRKRKEMRERALRFDEKVEELGLDAFENPREAVVGIYKNAVLWMELLGLPYKESWTHWEHAERVSLFKETFTGLTRLFEKAKYAPEKVTWDDAKRALELYRKMRGAVDGVK